MNKIEPIESTIDKVTTMSDRSLRLQVNTQELSAERMAYVMSMFGKYGYFIFAETDKAINDVDISALPSIEVTIEKEDRSPSKRLRAVMHILWQQTQDTTKISSEEFYRLEMEKIITHYKNKLD